MGRENKEEGRKKQEAIGPHEEEEETSKLLAEGKEDARKKM